MRACVRAVCLLAYCACPCWLLKAIVAGLAAANMTLDAFLNDTEVVTAFLEYHFVDLVVRNEAAQLIANEMTLINNQMISLQSVR
jgi:hypothetical protein